MSRGFRYSVSYSNPNLSPATPSSVQIVPVCLLANSVHQLRAQYENELELASPPIEWLGMERASAWEVNDDETAF